MKVLVLLASITLFAAGCASPTVLTERRAEDTSLSCPQLAQAMTEAAEAEREAREARGVTGMNVAAAVFFWPGLLGTYVNTEDAIEAANDRQDYLNALYTGRMCSF